MGESWAAPDSGSGSSCPSPYAGTVTGESAGAGAEATLLGRHEELFELRTGLDDAGQGRGRLFLLAGEAGIGKTRLLEALVDEAQPTEVRVTWGRCSQQGRAAPWWPWRQVLAACAVQASQDTLRRLDLGPGGGDIARLAPELTDSVPGLRPTRVSQWPDTRLRLFDAVTEFLFKVGADGGLIIALDDLHAADETSLRLLEHIADGLSRSNVLVVVTYRDAEVRSRPQIHRRMTSIARLGRRIVLPGLGGHHVARLLEQTLGEPADPTLAAEVHLATDGNPLFVQEIAHFVRMQPSGTTLAVPEELHAAIRRRLDHLTEAMRDVLMVGAVIGREFDLALLEAATDTEPDALLDILREATDLNVASRAGPGRWSFCHGPLREALYHDIRASRRAALHRRVGEALEKLLGDERDSRVGELAHHFFEGARGGDVAGARRYCTLAGDAALASLAFEEAAVQYGRALEALGLGSPVEERLRFDILMRLGQATLRLGELAQARDMHRRALKAARAVGSADLLAQAALGAFGEPEWTVGQTAASILEEARAALPDEDSSMRARVLAALASATSDRQVALDLSRQGVAMARRVGDVPTLRVVLQQWHHLNHDPDLLGERLAVADELVRLALDADDREGAQLARQWRSDDLFTTGDVAATSTELEVAIREARELRLPFLIWGTTFRRATVALLQGRLEDAERLGREALAAQERSEVADVEGVFAYQLWGLRREQGRVEEMITVARRRLESVSKWTPALRRAQLALALAELGNSDQAQQEIAAVVGELLDHGRWGRLCGPALVADVSWLVGAAQWAEETYRCISRWPNRHVVVGTTACSLGASDRYLGQLATLLGRLDHAEAHFQEAHRIHEELGAPGWLAHGRIDHARLLVARRRSGDLARARVLVAAARETYRALGMTAHDDRAAGLLETPSGRAGGATAEAASFSLEGEYWTIDYGGGQVRLRDSKGMRYLARLLASPGRELHALDLVVGEGGGEAVSPGAARRQSGLDGVGGGDAGAVLDAKAKAAYKRRLSELQSEIEEATAYHDLGRTDRAQHEVDFLMAELSAAVGLGGRDRKAASDAERARQSVTRAIKSALERIAEAHPTLGDHLRKAVRTGTYSAYVPDPRAPVHWDCK